MPQGARTWAESPAPLPSLPDRADSARSSRCRCRASDSTGSSALMRRATARSSCGSLGATRYTTERRNIGMLSSRSVTSIGCPDHMRMRSASSALTARNRSSASGPIARANAPPSSPRSTALVARSASTTACQTASDAPNAKVGLVWQRASPIGDEAGRAARRPGRLAQRVPQLAHRQNRAERLGGVQPGRHAGSRRRPAGIRRVAQRPQRLVPRRSHDAQTERAVVADEDRECEIAEVRARTAEQGRIPASGRLGTGNGGCSTAARTPCSSLGGGTTSARNEPSGTCEFRPDASTTRSAVD